MRSSNLRATTFIREILAPLLTYEQVMQIYSMPQNLQWYVGQASSLLGMFALVDKNWFMQPTFWSVTDRYTYIEFYMYNHTLFVDSYVDCEQTFELRIKDFDVTKLKEVAREFYESAYA